MKKSITLVFDGVALTVTRTYENLSTHEATGILECEAAYQKQVYVQMVAVAAAIGATKKANP